MYTAGERIGRRPWAEPSVSQVSDAVAPSDVTSRQVSGTAPGCPPSLKAREISRRELATPVREARPSHSQIIAVIQMDGRGAAAAHVGGSTKAYIPNRYVSHSQKMSEASCRPARWMAGSANSAKMILA